MFALPVLIQCLVLQLSSPSLIFYAFKQALHTCSSPDILNTTRAIERTLTSSFCLEFLSLPQFRGGVFKSDTELLELEWWQQIRLNTEQWHYNNLEKNSWLQHFYVFLCPEPGLSFRSHLNIIYEWWADQVDVGWAGTHLKPTVLGAPMSDSDPGS